MSDFYRSEILRFITAKRMKSQNFFIKDNLFQIFFSEKTTLL